MCEPVSVLAEPDLFVLRKSSTCFDILFAVIPLQEVKNMFLIYCGGEIDYRILIVVELVPDDSTVMLGYLLIRLR